MNLLIPLELRHGHHGQSHRQRHGYRSVKSKVIFIFPDTREVLVDLLSKIDVPEPAKRNKRKRKVLFEIDSNVECAEKRKKKEDWLYDDYHEELLRSRDEDDFWICSESKINELGMGMGMGMEEIAKQMQEHAILTSWMMKN